MNLSEGAFCFRFATEGPIEGNPSFHHQKHATCSSGKRPDYRRFTHFLLFFFFFFFLFPSFVSIHSSVLYRQGDTKRRTKQSFKETWPGTQAKGKTGPITGLCPQRCARGCDGLIGVYSTEASRHSEERRLWLTRPPRRVWLSLMRHVDISHAITHHYSPFCLASIVLPQPSPTSLPASQHGCHLLTLAVCCARACQYDRMADLLCLPHPNGLEEVPRLPHPKVPRRVCLPEFVSWPVFKEILLREESIQSV
ncbi:hypothetical protein LY78DRAFT_51462 [Colletotrichum sublineola]|nr:hypothetical protein LY78DRAFT_51462 [Colletotrichum sublineola]